MEVCFGRVNFQRFFIIAPTCSPKLKLCQNDKMASLFLMKTGSREKKLSTQNLHEKDGRVTLFDGVAHVCNICNEI